MNRQNILKTAIMLAATLLIAACTNDEMGYHGNALKTI